jgi:nucleotide-binding universal stress UspA family protein
MIDYILSLIYPNTASILSGFIKVIDRLEAHHARVSTFKDVAYAKSWTVKEKAKAKADAILNRAEDKSYDLVLQAADHSSEAVTALKAAKKLREALGL